MKLYYFPGACSLACHIALEWTGSAYQTVRMSLASTKSPEYLAMNPNGVVPLLDDDGFLLTENAAILGYIAELNPESGLLGDGSIRARAEVMRWLAYLNSDVHSAFKPIFSPHRFIDDRAQAEALARAARAHVIAHLERMDRHLADRDWLAGGRSIADPYLFVMLRWAQNKVGPLDRFENLAGFMGRMFDDDAVLAAIASEEGGPGPGPRS